MKKKVIGIVLTVILAVFLLGGSIGCKAKEGGEPSPGAPVGEKILFIGTACALSGPAAPWGLSWIQGARMWRDLVNEAGGIKVGGQTYKVELVSYDTKYTASEAVLVYKKLILQDHIKIIIGPFGETPSMIAVNPICQAEGALNLTVSTGFDGISPDWPLCLNCGTSVEDETQAGYYWLKEGHPEVKSVAMLAFDEYAGRGNQVFAQLAARKVGIDVAYRQLFPLDTVDFYPVVTAALKTNPDLIDTDGTFVGFVASIMEAAHVQGFKGIHFTSSYVEDVILAKVPPEYFEGSMCTYFSEGWAAVGTTPECLEYYNEFIKRNPGEWTLLSPVAYHQGSILLEGIKAADSIDPVKIADALRSMKVVHTPMGDAMWGHEELSGANHALHVPYNVVEIRNGKKTIVKTFNPPYPWGYDIKGIPGAEEFPSYWERTGKTYPGKK